MSEIDTAWFDPGFRVEHPDFPWDPRLETSTAGSEVAA